MSKFISWLKFYFIGFFTHNLSKESSKRNFLNTFLNLVLAFIIVCCGLLAGYTASFGVHYKNADEFRSFLYSAFAGENDRINLSVKDGRLTAEIADGEFVNTIIGEGEKYSLNGYRLIVDTRPSDTYADFTVKCKDSDGKEIGYGEYRDLSAEDKAAYTPTLTFSGKSLEPSDKLNEYEEFLNGTDSAAEAYAKIKNDLSSGEITDVQYAEKVYGLYIEYFYDGLLIDSYGNAPTLRTYYLSASTYGNAEKYVTVLDDVILCIFDAKGGVSVDFSGSYNKLADGIISGGGLSAEQMQSNIDEFILKSFAASGTLNFVVYIAGLGGSVIVHVIALMIMSFIVFMLFKIRRVQSAPNLTESLKIVGSFQLWSALITFILVFILSFFITRGIVFSVAEIILMVAILLRTVIYVVIELLSDKKKKAEQSEEQLNSEEQL